MRKIKKTHNTQTSKTENTQHSSQTHTTHMGAGEEIPTLSIRFAKKVDTQAVYGRVRKQRKLILSRNLTLCILCYLYPSSLVISVICLFSWLISEDSFQYTYLTT